MTKDNPKENTAAIEGGSVSPASPFISYIPASLFEDMGTPVKLPKNHIIIQAGETPDSCYLIKKGRVVAFEYTPAGDERIYNINDEGTLLFESGVVVSRPLTLSFKVNVPSVLIRIPMDTLKNAMRTDSVVAEELMRSISEKFIRVTEQMRHSSIHSIRWQVANLLITFAAKFGVSSDGKILISEKISQQRMANLLRVNRVTVARVIRELRDLKLIEQVNGFCCITDMERLQQYISYLDSTEFK